MNAPCILLNGAGLYDLSRGEYLATHTVDREIMERIVKCVLSVRADACIQVFSGHEIYETNPDQRDDPYSVMEKFPVIKLPLEEIPEPALKLLVAHTSPNLDAIYEAVMQVEGIEHFSVFRTCDWYLEFVANGVNKGIALGDTRSRCKDAKTILAIGDFNNDLEMVALADIGAAPANAIDEVKSAAHIVLDVDNNQSCVAHFLKQTLGI